jgi:hypothetical protein
MGSGRSEKPLPRRLSGVGTLENPILTKLVKALFQIDGPGWQAETPAPLGCTAESAFKEEKAYWKAGIGRSTQFGRRFRLANRVADFA